MFEIFMIVTNSSVVFLTSLIASVVIYNKYCKKYKEEKNQEHENIQEEPSNQSFLEGIRDDSISLSEDFSDLTENKALRFYS